MKAVQILPDACEPASRSRRRNGASPREARANATLPPSADAEAERLRAWEADYGSRRILGLRVDATSYGETTAAVVDLATKADGGMVCVANVHMLMEAFDDPEFRDLVNSADRVTPDGMPLVKALRGFGIARAERVYGPTLTPWVCRRAEQLGLSVGFYGGTPEVQDALQQRLRQDFPKLQIDYAHAPPFRPLEADEDAAVVAAIRASGVKILFVGLGCPKQERWMAAHRDALPCVQLGVGAAFDFIAGRKRQAPAWMQDNALEWLFRLATEPKRLWRRYLVGNSRFVYHFARLRLASRAAPEALAPPR